MPDMLVRYKHGKTTFEVLTKEGTVSKYRDGALKSLGDVVVADVVFTDHSKGLRASGDQLKSAFGTDNVQECLECIVKKGDFQLSASERREIYARKRAEIIEYLHKNYLDPSKSPALPIPVTRIENALTQMKARIDMDLPADRQATDLVPKMVEIMPMRKAATMSGLLVIPHKHVGASSSIVQKNAKVTREDYDANGAVISVEVSPGDYDTLMRELQRATKGEFEFHVEGGAASSEAAPSPTAKKQGKGKKKKGRKGK